MSAYAETISRGHAPKAGEICIVQSSEDGAWYRAACMQAEQSTFLCFQVDYGKVVTASLEQIRRIPKRLVEFLPYQAAHCVLQQFDNEVEVPVKVMERVAQLMPSNDVFDVTVIKFIEDRYIVDIPSVSSVLKQEGLI